MSAPPRRGTVIAALLAVQVLFGLHYPFIKPAFDAGLDPGAWAAVRVVCATLLLLGTARWFSCPFPRQRRDLWGLAGVAVLGVVVNQICFSVGLSYTTPGYSALINVTIPVMALVFAWALGFERPNLMRGCGVAVAASGVVFMLTGQLEADWRTGNLLTFINALSFGGFLVASRPLYRRVHPYSGTAVIFAFGAIGILAAVGWRIPMVDWLALPWWAWGAMAYAVLGATVGTYALNAFALRHADSSVVGFFIFLQPLVATSVSTLTGNERPDWRFGVAALLVAIGVTIVVRRPVATQATATVGVLVAGFLVTGCGTPMSETPMTARESAMQDTESGLLARAAKLELDTNTTPPPGEALHHHTAGFARTLCSAVFLTGLDPEDAAVHIGGFTSPFEERRHVVDRVVDVEAQSVSLTLPDGVTRVARRYKNQGCVALPIGEDSVFFTPTDVSRNLPPVSTTPWPMGDVLPDEPWPVELDMAKVQEALDAGFGPPEARTLAFLVTYKGRILGERYSDEVDVNAPLESWSMSKSLTGTLVGVLVQQGDYELWQSAPIPEWQAPGDPRQEILIGDIMRMSSGLRIRAPQDPDYDPSAGYPDHVYLYTGTVNSYEYAATRPQQWLPNTVGRYRNTDPVLASYLIRLAVEARGESYHAFPQRNLFDKIGIRDAIIETDPYGNFLGQGRALMPARDWARLANLYLTDGVWNGERLLPEGWVDYAATPAPAWVADGRPLYGGSHFWVNAGGADPIPDSAFSMRGAGGQSTTLIPTHQLVVVRIGKYTGAEPGGRALRRAFELLMEAVPPVERPRRPSHPLVERPG